MLGEIRKLREKLGMPEIGDDFQIKESSEAPTPFIPPSEAFTDPPSWTTVYKNLKDGQNSSESCSEDVHESSSEIHTIKEEQ